LIKTARGEEVAPFHQLESSAGVFLTVPGTDISFEGRIGIWKKNIFL
jgi:hypothetical protein